MKITKEKLYWYVVNITSPLFFHFSNSSRIIFPQALINPRLDPGEQIDPSNKEEGMGEFYFATSLFKLATPKLLSWTDHVVYE